VRTSPRLDQVGTGPVAFTATAGSAPPHLGASRASPTRPSGRDTPGEHFDPVEPPAVRRRRGSCDVRRRRRPSRHPGARSAARPPADRRGAHRAGPAHRGAAPGRPGVPAGTTAGPVTQAPRAGRHRSGPGDRAGRRARPGRGARPTAGGPGPHGRGARACTAAAPCRRRAQRHHGAGAPGQPGNGGDGGPDQRRRPRRREALHRGVRAGRRRRHRQPGPGPSHAGVVAVGGLGRDGHPVRGLVRRRAGRGRLPAGGRRRGRPHRAPGGRPAGRRRPGPRQRRARRAPGGRPAHPLPGGRPAARRDDGAAQRDRVRREPHQDRVGPGHRRASPSPGRPGEALRRRDGRGGAGLDAAHAARGEGRHPAAPPRRERPAAHPHRSDPPAAGARRLGADPEPGTRADHRTDRFGQDQHPLRRHPAGQHPRPEHRHPRGPGRGAGRRHHPGAGARALGPDLRARSAQHPAAGPGHRPGR